MKMAKLLLLKVWQVTIADDLGLLWQFLSEYLGICGIRLIDSLRQSRLLRCFLVNNLRSSLDGSSG